jgi:hypothetical protein
MTRRTSLPLAKLQLVWSEAISVILALGKEWLATQVAVLGILQGS